MRTLQIILFVCTVGATCLYLMYSFYNVDGKVDRYNPDRYEPKRMKPTQSMTTKIYPTYYDDDLHVNWSFITNKNYDESDLCEWNEPKKLVNKNVNGIGEAGVGYVPSDDMKELMDKLLKEHNYNLLASDMISIHRSLPDPRIDECKKLSYPEKLPTTSVIIIFHNEAWTTLFRTVWSILDRSPAELIKEIILVDDLSTWPFLKRPLHDYIELLPVRIKLIRNSKREGLIRARLIGATHATGSVLIFLDAHMECTNDWLQPLLARIASDRSVIAVPLIDGISSDDMKYQYNSQAYINGFSWTLSFNWMPIPDRELIRTHYDKTAPIRTPTLVGCGFAIDREFFFEIGGYDEGMNIWGSENIEMSLRVWQCGGSMEVIRCSRIGHLYRRSTYSFNGDAGEITAQNSVRVVEVWMDEFKHLYYAVNPGHKNVSGGDLTKRIELKQRLKCKNFRWLLENVFPESNMRMEFEQLGEIKNVLENKCADTCYGGKNTPLTLVGCHGRGGNQLFAFAKNQLIATQNSEGCIGVKEKLVVSVKCMDQEPPYLWKYFKDEQWLVHVASGLCMQSNKTEIILAKCDPADASFNWEINS